MGQPMVKVHGHARGDTSDDSPRAVEQVGENLLKRAAGPDDFLGPPPADVQRELDTRIMGRIIRPRTRTDPLPTPQSSGHRAEPVRARGLSLLADGLQRLSLGSFLRPSIATDDETTPKAPSLLGESSFEGTPPMRAHVGERGTSLCGATDGGSHHERGANAAAAAKGAPLIGGSEDPPGAASNVAAPTHSEISSPPLTTISPSRSGLSAPRDPPGSRHRRGHLDAALDLFSDNTTQAGHEQLGSWSPQRLLHTPEPEFAPGTEAARSRPSTPRTPVSTQPIPIPRKHRPSPTTPLTGRYHSHFAFERHFLSEERGFRDFDYTVHSQDHRPISRGKTSPPNSPGSTLSSSDALIFESNSLVEYPAHHILRASPEKRNVSTVSPLRAPSDIKHRRAFTAGHIRPSQVMNRPERSSQNPTPPTPSQLSPYRKNPQSTYNMTAQRKPAANLQMPALPRFHPAVYQSPNSSASNSPTGHRSVHGRSASGPQLPHLQRSGPQQQLYQYQRELIASVSRTVGGASQSTTPYDTPKAPSLHPCGSPGPATPLALEEDSDYLSAGVIGAGGSRELVDKLIREEHERRNGLGTGHSSPAVSPAGGRD